jgi:glycosyltransferase involved in cell wall biosynthesis
MKISIITPTYNSENTIADTLDSISKQKLLDVEVEHIIIDGLSNDQTCQIIKEKNPQSITVSEKDSGIYDAMNKGIKMATGDIVSILNSDDMYFDETVLSIVSKEFQNTNVDIVYGHIVYVDSQDINKITRIWKTGPIRNVLLWLGWIMPHPAVFVRKRAYDEIGLFDIKYKISADYDFLLKVICSKKYKINFLDKVLVSMRTGGTSDTSVFSRIKEWETLSSIFNKYYKTFPFWFFVTRPLIKFCQFFYKSNK